MFSILFPLKALCRLSIFNFSIQSSAEDSTKAEEKEMGEKRGEPLFQMSSADDSRGLTATCWTLRTTTCSCIYFLLSSFLLSLCFAFVSPTQGSLPSLF